MRDPVYAGKQYVDVAAVARRRGHQFAKAVNAEYPGIHILSLHAWETMLYYSPLTAEGVVDRDRLATLHMSLFPPFMDGVLEGSDDNTVLIDGIEGGYNCVILTAFWPRPGACGATALSSSLSPICSVRRSAPASVSI